MVIDVHPLDEDVLAVAVELPGKTWNAYIGAVNGEDYDAGAREEARTGRKSPSRWPKSVLRTSGGPTTEEAWSGMRDKVEVD